MTNRLLHTPEGVRDIYNEECEKKLCLQESLHRILKLYGYRDIQTPTFEYFDIFSKETGTIPSREMYKFFDREGDTLVLRPDMTPSVARAVSKYFRNETMPIRLCYMGNTFLNHESYQGRLKEIAHLGAEFIGNNSVNADAEMIALVIDLLLKAGLKDFQVEVGEVNFFKGLLEEAGIDEETEIKLREFISKKNYFGVEELLSEQDMGTSLKEAFLKMPEIFGSVEKIREAREMTKNVRATEAIERLEKLYNVMCYYGLEKYMSFDLGMLSKYKYYTGIIFNGYTYGTGNVLVKGGRYDNLLGHFGKPAPSVGFVIEMDQLLLALNRQNITIPIGTEKTLVLYEASTVQAAVKLANNFRKQGMEIELTERQSLKQLLEYEEYGKKNLCGGILYLKDEKMVEVINLLTGERNGVELNSLLQ